MTLEEELKALMTPVRKNTTDLEAGLQELAELSQHVQIEMASQRDTLDGLLETMQKTISIEVSQPPLRWSFRQLPTLYALRLLAGSILTRLLWLCAGHPRPARGAGAPPEQEDPRELGQHPRDARGFH